MQSYSRRLLVFGFARSFSHLPAGIILTVSAALWLVVIFAKLCQVNLVLLIQANFSAESLVSTQQGNIVFRVLALSFCLPDKYDVLLKWHKGSVQPASSDIEIGAIADFLHSLQSTEGLAY